MNEHLLLVEDDDAIAVALRLHLEDAGYRLHREADGRHAMSAIDRQRFDLVLLDLMLPGADGWEVCRHLRARHADTPVIMLSARSAEAHRVLGLELGADDYVTKPFSPRELVARVRARLRRVGTGTQARAEAGEWVARGAFAIDREGHRIRYRQQLLDQTRYEYAVLDALLQRPGAILSRAQLMDRGWDSAADSADRTVDTHVKTLRAKLRAAGASGEPIRTHRGLGYALEV